VLADLIIAPFGAAADVVKSNYPSKQWEGLSFKGLDNVKLATLLSILSSGSPSIEYETWLDALPMTGDSEGPWVFSLTDQAIKSLATIASKNEDAFEELAELWHATDEFEGWLNADVTDLLEETGNLADTAATKGMGLFLWVSL